MKKLQNTFVLFLTLTAIIINTDCSGQSSKAGEKADLETKKYKVTFIELGSVKCIPCQKMQPVMKSIGDKYGPQVNVLFYDVWKSEQRHYAGRYGIRVIPTQVFLDRDGKEFFRHEGYFPESEIDKLLQKRGL